MTSGSAQEIYHPLHKCQIFLLRVPKKACKAWGLLNRHFSKTKWNLSERVTESMTFIKGNMFCIANVKSKQKKKRERRRRWKKELNIYLLFWKRGFCRKYPTRDRLSPRSPLLPSPLPLSFPFEVRHHDECPPSEVGQRDRCPPPETWHRDRCPPPEVPIDYTSNYFTDYTKTNTTMTRKKQYGRDKPASSKRQNRDAIAKSSTQDSQLNQPRAFSSFIKLMIFAIGRFTT